VLQELNEEKVKVSHADLVRALAAHERYATGRGGVRAQFKGADLADLVLANRMLDEAEFTAASLVGANLYGSSLVRASFYCADLRNCDLRNTKLINADLRGASFRGANLANAVLDRADLRAATMVFVSRHEFSVIDRSETPGGTLGGVDFSNCSLRNTSFGNAKLDGANFSGAILIGVCFRGARMTDACFHDAVLMGTDVKELHLPREAFDGCVMDSPPEDGEISGRLKSMLADHQRWVNSGGRTGAGAVMDGLDVRPLHDAIAGLSLTGLSARNTIGVAMDFSECQLQGAKFDGADLRGANFSRADLSGASFKGAKLRHAVFEGSKLLSLPLRDRSVLKPTFEGADVSEQQFRYATIDAPLAITDAQPTDAAD